MAAAARSRVAGGDRLGDGGVLGGGGGQPGGVVGGQPADADQVDAQAAQRLDEVGVGDGGVDGRVEPADQPVVRRAGRGPRAPISSGACGRARGERGEGRRVAARGGQRGGLALERLAQLEELVDVVERDVGDDDAAAALPTSTSPSAASRASASRSGVRETPRRADCSTSPSTVPGGRRHSMMSSRRAA